MPAFTTAYSDDALLAAVRDVVAHVDAGDPAAVEQAAFNAGRAEAGHPRLPAAKQIARRLGMGWYEVLAFAHDPGGNNDTHGLALRLRNDRRPLELDEVVVALRICAHRAGLSALRPARYDAERDAIITAQRRAHRHGSPNVQFMPPSQQIEQQIGWDTALVAAGLAPREPAPRRRGVPLVEVLDRFVDDVGALPWSQRAVDAYARTNDISVNGLNTLAARLDDLRARRAAAGKWTPLAPPPRGQRPSPEVRGHARPAGDPPRLRYRPELQEVVAGVAEAYRLAGSRPLTQVLHRQLAAASAGAIPAPSTVQRVAARHATTPAEIRRAASDLAQRPDA